MRYKSNIKSAPFRTSVRRIAVPAVLQRLEFVAVGEGVPVGAVILQAQARHLRQGRHPRVLPHHVEPVVHNTSQQVINNELKR